MEKLAIYVGEPITLGDLSVGYGMTGVACKRKGITDNTNFVFEVDGKSNTLILLPETDLYFGSEDI